MNKKNIKKQKNHYLEQRKLHTGSSVLQLTTETLKLRLWVKFILFGFQTSTEYEYE